MTDREYAIAPGFNNIGGLLVVTSIVVSGKAFWTIQGMGHYDDGEEQVKLSGIHDDIGDPAFSWLSTRMTVEQYEYLIATPLQGKRSNRTTVKTRFRGKTYYTVNAFLTLPKTNTLTRSGGSYLDVPWSFTYDSMAS